MECLLEGLDAIFRHIGSVPNEIWFDNVKTSYKSRGRSRKRSGTRGNFLVSVPRFISLPDFNRLIMCEEDADREHYRHNETIEELFAKHKGHDTMLEEIRKALNLSGEEGPYVLVPHSMSGLEAIYCAQNYPDEVKAIIGLDIAIPDIYVDSSFSLPSKGKLYLIYFISRIGLTRFMGRGELEKKYPILKSEELS